MFLRILPARPPVALTRFARRLASEFASPSRLTANEWEKLNRLVGSTNGTDAVDWFALADEHFPGHDAIELRSMYEFQQPSSSPVDASTASRRVFDSDENALISRVMRAYHVDKDKPKAMKTLADAGIPWRSADQRYQRMRMSELWSRDMQLELLDLVGRNMPWSEIAAHFQCAPFICMRQYKGLLGSGFPVGFPTDAEDLAHRRAIRLMIRRQVYII